MTAARPSIEAFMRDAEQMLDRQKSTNGGSAARCALLGELISQVQQQRQRRAGPSRWSLLLAATVLVYALSVARGFSPTPQEIAAKWASKPCLYKAWMFLLETSRYPSDCQATCGSMASGQVDIESYQNLTRERFARVYGNPSRPVIVRNATLDWPAMKHFNLSFFRDLYDRFPGAYAPHHKRNKLLPFRLPLTYRKLRQAFHMSEADQAKPWYFGWSNVDLNVHWELQKYYKIPDFLPDDTEHGQMEWFFMGTSQEAAYLHVDHTVKPAWQAQIRGRKVWELHPPAECMFQCSPVRAHLQEGDIFVVDPSVWYHGTFIYPGEMSITFGMEFV